MKTRSLVYSGVFASIVVFATGAFTQDYPGTDAIVIRGLYYPGPEKRTDEIYIFPLAATETALAFASCPFVELPDGSGQEETVCYIEWLEATDGEYQPTRREGIKGCTVADHLSNECPGFGGDGFSYGNTVRLLDSLRKTYPTPSDLFPPREVVTTDIFPPTLPNLEGTMQISRYEMHQMSLHFGLFDTCDIYSEEVAFAEACGRAVEVVSEGQSILGVTAMVIQERGIVCAVTEDWSITACSDTR